jgi:hypothetical protein
MSYCLTADVQGLNPKRAYTATSTPTLTQVGEYISKIAGEIDTVLQGRGLTTPVTLPAVFVEFLEQLNAVGAAALAERAMFPEASGMMGGTSAAALHWKQYQDGLKYLKDGQLPSSLDSLEALPFSFFEQNQATEEEPEETYEWPKTKFGKNKEF